MTHVFPFKKVKFPTSYIAIQMFDKAHNPDEAGEDVEGLASFKKGCIFLQEGYPVARTKLTFLHELCHMLVDVEGVKDLSEAQTDVMANSLLYFLQNNKKLVEYLSEKETTSASVELKLKELPKTL